MPYGYSKGDEIHHVMGLQDHLRPLVQGLDEADNASNDYFQKEYILVKIQ